MKMMKKAGFTLVELIVVITILAILGTIAFISLQGNTQDAKNSKVSSDLRSLVTAIEVATTKGDTTLIGIYGTGTVADNSVTGAAFSGVTLTGSENYNVGTIDFTALKQSSDSFVDPDGNQYVYSYIANGSEAYYQIAGEITEVSGLITKYVKGNYIKGATTDVDGLISTSSSTGALTNDTTGTGSLY